MSKIKLIVVIGRSASGKDTLVKGIVKKFPNLHPIIHYTTRPKRDNETGEEYHFISMDKYERMVNNQEFFVTTCFNNWYYAIGLDSFEADKINIGVFNPIELKRLMTTFSDLFDIYIVETVTDRATRYRRSLNRLNDHPFDDEGLKEMCRRDRADEEDFKTIENIPRAKLETGDYCIYTTNFTESYETDCIKRLIEAKKEKYDKILNNINKH